VTARYSTTRIDLGTGDGRFVLAAAAAEPDRLVIGVDADATSMAEASRRAAGRPKRGGLPNALFVVATAEALPRELDGLADALTVQFPWGSLLRGLLRANSAVLGGLVRVTRPGAEVTLLLSVTERDHAMGLPPLDAQGIAALAPAYAAHGLEMVDVRPAGPDDLARTHLTWARRIGAGRLRPAWLARFRRAGR